MHLAFRREIAVLLCGIVGCSAPEGAPVSPTPAPTPGAPEPCGPGETPREDGGCTPAGLPPDLRCAPGQTALDSGGCQEAGVPSERCGEGLEPDGDGGCRAILPEGRCPAGQMAIPGEVACRDIAPCGEGDYGDIPIDGTTQFVHQAYAGEDSDGSQARPWRTLKDAVDAAEPGAIIAVAAGRYAESVTLHSPVRIWGRCPRLVEVAGSATSLAAIDIRRSVASGAEVRGVALTGPGLGVLVSGATDVVLDRIWVHGAATGGITAADDAGPTSLALRGSLVEENRSFGVLGVGAGLSLDGSVIRDNLAGTRAAGQGLIVQGSPSTKMRGVLTLRTSLIEHNRAFNVFIAGSDATIESSVIRHGLSNASGELGRGIQVQDSLVTRARSALTLRSSLIELNQDVGVFVLGSTADIEASIIRDTQPDAAGRYGWGLTVQRSEGTREPGELSMRASLIERSRDVGMLFVAATADVASSVVRDIQAGTELFGYGIAVQPGADGGPSSLSLRSSVVSRAQASGIVINNCEATIDASLVRATQPRAVGDYGRGISVQQHADVTSRGKLHLRASMLEDNHEVGLFVNGADAVVEASVIRATQPNPLGIGRGISVQEGEVPAVRGALSLRSSLIEGSHDSGVFIVGADAIIDASVIQDTQGGSFGDGINVLALPTSPAKAEVTATRITSSERAGILFVDGVGKLSRVAASKNRFGLVVQGSVAPSVDELSVFAQNLDQDTLIDGDLAVPNRLSPLP